MSIVVNVVTDKIKHRKEDFESKKVDLDKVLINYFFDFKVYFSSIIYFKKSILIGGNISRIINIIV